MNAWLVQFLILVRERPLFTGCLILTALVGALNYPLWQRRLAVADQHAAIQHDGEFMVEALTNRATIEEDLALLRTSLARIDHDLIDERSMEINLGYFYTLERTSRVRLVRLNQLATSAPPPGSRYKAVPFAIEIVGSYRDSMTFLRALETGPRLLRIRNCSFERGTAESSDLTCTFTVDVLARI